MKRVKLIVITIISIILTTSIASAQPFGFLAGDSRKTGDFSLKKSFNVVSSPNVRTENIMSKRISQFLRGKGATLTESNGTAARNITITQTNQIEGAPEGEKDVYSISIYKNLIEIKYTSPKSMRWAFGLFCEQYYQKGSVFSKNGSGLIRGGEICQWSGVDAGGIFIDQTIEHKSISELIREMESAIERNISTIYLSLISPSSWCIESDALNLVNPTENICQGKGYSMIDLNVIYQYAQREGIEIVPILDFTSKDNEVFKRYTGHEIHSLEGLRFTRAFTKEFCKNSEFDRISFGGEIAEKEQRNYITPLVDIVKSYSKEAIIIELKK